MDLQDKVVVITGAAQGLGQKMAEIIAGHGAKLATITTAGFWRSTVDCGFDQQRISEGRPDE